MSIEVYVKSLFFRSYPDLKPIFHFLVMLISPLKLTDWIISESRVGLLYVKL